MLKYNITNTYVLEFELKGNENYKFTKDNICINVKTNRLIKCVLNGSSKGYWVNKKFYSLNTLRSKLQRIKEIECPF
jgi:hypothetical protein